MLTWKKQLHHTLTWKQQLHHMLTWKQQLHHMLTWKQQLHHMLTWKQHRRRSWCAGEDSKQWDIGEMGAVPTCNPFAKSCSVERVMVLILVHLVLIHLVLVHLVGDGTDLMHL